jgi:hypothetical protein
MYGDTTVIRRLAGTLREQGADIRAEAGALVGQAEAVPWTGLAADAMRALSRAHAGDLQACANRHDDAAEALDRHAREVDHLEDLIATIERKVVHLIDSFGHGLSGLAHGLVGHVVPDGMDHWLDHFDAPVHGSMEWLEVHVPRPSWLE